MTQLNDFSSVLEQAQSGDEGAREELFRLLCTRMRVAAEGLMAKERVDHTLQPSAVVNEAVLKLMSSDAFAKAENRRFLFGAANRAMKQVLVDHARKRSAEKRPTSAKRSSLDSVLATLESRDRTNIEDLTNAIKKLRSRSPRQAEVLELSFFSDLQHNEIGRLLDISVATVKRDLALAKAKLASDLHA